MSAIGRGRLGLVTGLRTFDAWSQASASAKRVHVEARPRSMVSNWSVYSGATYVATFGHTFDGVLMAVTGVRHGLSTLPLERAETLADCLANEDTFFFDPNLVVEGRVGHWDDGVSLWDGADVIFDQSTHLYVHLPLGASPLSTHVAAEISFWWSNEGEVIPDFGAEKLSNGGFESWDTDEAPTDWSAETNSAAGTIAEDSDELVGGFRSLRFATSGGTVGTWDDGGTTVWDAGVEAARWDRVANPLLGVVQTVSLRAGRMYRLSGAYRTDVANDVGLVPSVRLGIPSTGEFIEEDGFGSAGGFIALPETRGDWRRYALDFIAWRDTDAAEVDLRLWRYAGAAPAPAGSAWFDDVRLRCIWRWVFAAPRLADVPPAKQSSRDVFFGGKSTGGGTLTVINADAKLEPELALLTWEGAEVRFRCGGDFPNGERMLAEDFVPAFAGLIDTAETDDRSVVLAMRDAGEFFNVQVPPNTYTQAQYPALAEGFADQPKPIFFGPKTGISGVPVVTTANGYRTYELCDVSGNPAGIKSVDAVYAYVDTQAADSRDVDHRSLLTAGTDYSVDLALARVTLLSDVRLYEVTTEHNVLDFRQSTPTELKVAKLTPGFYTARALQAMTQDAIRAVGGSDHLLTYDETTHKWTWSRGSGTLELLRKTGDNKNVSAWETFGFKASENDLTGALTYTGDDPTFEDADRQHVVRIDATGLADDSSGTYTGTPGAAIQIMPDIVRFLVSVVARRPEAVDGFSFEEARTTAPQVLGLYLKERMNLRDVLDRMEYSSGADIVLDGDGVFYVIVATDDVPPNVVDVFDRDYLSFKMATTVRDVLHTVTLKFDEDPSTGKFRTREVKNEDVALRYGRSPSREFETYLTSDADAVVRVAELAELAASARRLAQVKVKGKLTRARIGTKVRLTRSRGVSTSGALDRDLFRIIAIEKAHLDAVASASMVEV